MYSSDPIAPALTTRPSIRYPNSAIVQTKTILQNTLVLASTVLDDKAAKRNAGLTKLVGIYAQTKALEVGNKIRKKGGRTLP
jgi:hypothetical protein